MIHTVHIQPGGYTLWVHPDETILQAALRQDYQFPWACQQAICGTCQGQLLAGEVVYDVPLYAITEAQQNAGAILLCSAKPRSDLIIAIEGVAEPARYSRREITCPIADLQPLEGGVIRVLLAQPPEPFVYRAGQYIEVLSPPELPRPFSLANAPDAQQLELHIRHFHDNPYTTALVEQLKNSRQLTLKGPYGKMGYQRTPAYPLLFIAGGTGFAPFKALLEQIWRDPAHPPVYLYWVARTRADLYWHTLVEHWMRTQNHFHYYPVLSQPAPADQWQGAVGMIHEHILQQHPSLAYFHIYASGPPDMVFSLRDSVLAHGAAASYFYSDWLDYVPDKI